MRRRCAEDMLGDYLAKYPEVRAKDADAIVEKALLATYTQGGARAVNSAEDPGGATCIHTTS